MLGLRFAAERTPDWTSLLCANGLATVPDAPELMCLTTFQTMIGHSDYHVTGTLKDWDIFGGLDRITVPTLVLGGEFDECVPAHLVDIAVWPASKPAESLSGKPIQRNLCTGREVRV